MPHVITFLIAMVSLFIVFSTLASGAVEAWNSAFGKRGTYLWKGIARLIGPGASGAALLAALRAHPAMLSLCRDDGPGSRASYVPSALFADALIDVVMARAPTMRLHQYGPAEAIALLPDDLPLKRTLLLEWARAGGDPVRLHAGVARLFDDSMDRVSGWYKRDAQARLFWIGLALAGAFDLDAVHIAIALWQSPDAVNQLATHAASSGATSTAWPAEIPMGWPAPWQDCAQSSQAGHGHPWHVVAALIGMVTMAASGVIGAPTWFQLLSLLVPLRGAGKLPARASAPATHATPADSATPVLAAPVSTSPVSPQAGLNDFEQAMLTDDSLGRVRQALDLPADGGFDSALRTAIRQEQARRGYAATGQLTRLLAQDLG
jgi:hypothetical protein